MHMIKQEERGISGGHIPGQGTTGNRRLLREGELASLRDDPSNWLSNTKWSALKPYPNTKNGLNRFYLYTCAYAQTRKK